MSGQKIAIIVAGQSNSLGTNGQTISAEAYPLGVPQWQALAKKSDLVLDDTLDIGPGDLDAPAAKVFMLSRNNAGNGSGSLNYVPAAAGTFMPAQNPVQSDDSWKQASTFAFQMCKKLRLRLGPNDEIYIIHAGLGATSLGPGDIRQNVDWDPSVGVDSRQPGGNSVGIWYPDRPVPGVVFAESGGPNGLNRYARMIQFVNEAKVAQPTLKIAGMVWHQGEADCTLDYRDYFTELNYLFNRTRNDLNEPNMPIVVGTMQSYWQVNGARVHATHLHGASWLDNVQVARMLEVNEADTQINPYALQDRTHISRDGHRLMAKRYFKSFSSLRFEGAYTATTGTVSFPATSPICLEDLHEGLDYQITIAATNGTGTGAGSPAQTFQILTPPMAPIGLVAAPTPASGTVFLEWSLGLEFEGGCTFVRYEIEVTPSIGAPFAIIKSPRNPADHLVTGLSDALLYSFRVRSRVMCGGASVVDSPYSTSTPQVRPGVPSACTGVAAVPGHGGGVNPALYSALIVYAPPLQFVESSVLEYEATSSPGGFKGVVSLSGFILMRGLSHGVAYTFTVRARNASGYGPASAPSAPVTPLNTIVAAGPPLAVNVTTSGQTATINITPPASDGGSPIAAYRAEVVPLPGAVWLGIQTVFGGTTIVVPDLFIGMDFFVIVWALTAAGWGGAFGTHPTLFTPTVSPPSAPTSVSVTPLGGGQAQVSFVPSASLGGATRVYYRAHSSVGGIYLDARASPITVTGLTLGIQTFTVRAAHGDGYLGTPIGTRSATSGPSSSVNIT